MTWQTFVFLPVLIAGGGWATYRFLILFKMLKAHRGQGPKLNRIPERVAILKLFFTLGQRAVLKKPVIGILHALIFWGFIIITTGTLEQFATTISPSLHFSAMGHLPYSWLVFFQDLFTFLVFVAVIAAAIRRLIVKPKNLGQSRDANLILLFTGGLMISIFLMNGFEILAGSPWYAQYMYFSSGVSGVLAQFGFSASTAASLATLFKWIHMLLVLGFGVYIPGSKHLHIIAAGPNTFLKSFNVKNQ